MSSSKNIIFPRFKTDDLRKTMSIENDVSCDLEALFNDIKIIQSHTESQSVQMFAKIKPQSLFKILKNSKIREVFLKISMVSDNSNLAVEIGIYAELTRLLLDGHSPNLIRYIASFNCFYKPQNIFWDEFEERLLPYDMSLDYQNLVSVGAPVQVLVSEKTTGIILKKWLENNPRNIISFIKICIQIIYTLQCFAEIEFRHNDLHWENIFVESVKPSPMFYFTGYDTYYMISTSAFVKIFDFDMASFASGSGLTNESFLNAEFCPEYGMCIDKNNKFDLFTILYYLRVYAFIFDREGDVISKWIAKMAKKTIKSRELLSQKCCRFNGRLCKVLQPSGDCDPTWVPTDREMLSPELLLETSLFDQYRFTLSKNQHKKEFINVFSKPPGKNELCYMYDQIYCLPSINKLKLISHIVDVIFD